MIMKISRRFRAALVALSFAVALVPGLASAGSLEDDAKAFVGSLADQAIKSLTGKDVSRADRVTNFRALFNEHFAVKGIGKFVLSRYWKKANEAEQAEYLKLFEDLMVVSYVDRFAQYAGEKLSITKAIPKGDKNATVFSEIQPEAGGKGVRVDWKVATKDGAVFKVVDVVVEGTSMSQTLRSDFGSIIKQKGGKVSGLLEVLREKTASLNKG